MPLAGGTPCMSSHHSGHEESRTASEEWSLTARWLFPVAGPPLQRGVVVLRGDRIVAVEPRGVRTADRDLGNTALMPGLVNAHTHLDLAGLRDQVAPSRDFTGWLREVIGHRRSRSAAATAADIDAGIRESLASGTTLVGDISAQGMSWDSLSRAPLRAVVFIELLGLTRPRARQAWADTRSWLQAHPATATCRPGLSPHAPYSVRASLYRTAAGLARQRGLPLTTHLAETPEELELLERRAGPFVEFLSNLGVWDPRGLARGIDAILDANRNVASLLLAHGNYLPVRSTLPAGSTLVYCPRTHHRFGHAAHPFRTWLAAGVRVALGTDSLASNPDLDVLGEARFLHERHPELPADQLLRMATLSGAEALGWADETGSLTPGKSADLVVLPLPNEEYDDPHELLLASPTGKRGVISRGAILSIAEA